MPVISQLVIAVLGATVFRLLLSCVRRQDAMQNMFLISLLLCGMVLLQPDAVVFFPVVWWAFFMLRASNLRTYLASLLALLTMGLYAAIVAFVWPESGVVQTVLEEWQGVWHRSVFHALDLWAMVLSGCLGLLGLWSMVAHLRRYATANVRIQTRVLLVIPVFFLSLLSVVFPAADSLGLLSLLWLSSAYLMVLYLATYGFPRINMKRQSSASSRRLSRRADSQNPFRKAKKSSGYASASRRSFSGRSRRR